MAPGSSKGVERDTLSTPSKRSTPLPPPKEAKSPSKPWSSSVANEEQARRIRKGLRFRALSQKALLQRSLRAPPPLLVENCVTYGPTFPTEGLPTVRIASDVFREYKVSLDLRNVCAFVSRCVRMRVTDRGQPWQQFRRHWPVLRFVLFSDRVSLWNSGRPPIYPDYNHLSLKPTLTVTSSPASHCSPSPSLFQAHLLATRSHTGNRRVSFRTSWQV